MTPTGQTVCLCMIVKDEAHVIAGCLASVRPLLDHWIVIDWSAERQLDVSDPAERRFVEPCL